MVNLSALIVVNNEEKQLQQCIETVKFVDEIVIILDKCTDNSKLFGSKNNSLNKLIYSLASRTS